MEMLKLNSSPSENSQNKKSGVSKITVAVISMVVAGLTAAITWTATYYSDHTAHYSQMLSSARSELAAKNAEWTNSALITELPLGDRKSDLIKNLMTLRSGISSFYTNDVAVDTLIVEYRSALEDAMGAVNSFDGSEATLRDMINSLQHASNIGGELGVQIGDLSASFPRKLQATLLSKRSGEEAS